MSQPPAWEAARAYADRSWRVAPASLGNKYPRIKEWQTKATIDPAQINAWFPVGQNQNVCIITGPESGIWVLDIDTKTYTDKDGVERQKVGAQTLADLEEELGPLPLTYEVRTWSGGRHLYFNYSGIDFEIRNTVGSKGKSVLGKDLDVRGSGGQVVAPPSAVELDAYRLVHDVPVAALPPAWIEKLRPAAEAAPGATGQESELTAARLSAIGESALNKAVLDIGISAPNEGNETVNRCAYTIGRLVARGCLTRAAAESALRRAYDDLGHDRSQADANATVASGLDAGEANPKEPWPPVDRPLRGGKGKRAVSDRVEVQGGQDRPRRGTWPGEFNDSANADLFVQHAKGVMLTLSDRGSWAAWNGQRWTTDSGQGMAAASRLWQDVAGSWQCDELPQGEMNGMTKEEQKEAEGFIRTQAAWRKASLMNSGIRNCLSVAQSSSDISATMAAFDTSLTELNTPGGIVDLETGSIRSNEASAMHTQITSVKPENGMPQKWLLILEAVSGGDESWVELLQTLMGYSLTGVQTDATFPFLSGPGGAGKSLILNTLGDIMGDYATSLEADALMAGRQKHAQNIAMLTGKRFARASEVNEGDRFDEAKLKLLTGGDEITANFMRENSFTFIPTHHLWMMGNDLPRVATGGQGMWRRMIRIPFEHAFPEHLKGKQLRERMVATEGGQILSWALEGAQRYLSQGLSIPDRVRTATEAYRAEEDDVSRFLDELTQLDESAFTPSGDLYEAFHNWSERGGERYPLKIIPFGRRLKAMGLKDERRTIEGEQLRGWVGVKFSKAVWKGMPYGR